MATISMSKMRVSYGLLENKLGILDIIDWIELDNADNLDVKNKGGILSFGQKITAKLGILDIVNSRKLS